MDVVLIGTGDGRGPGGGWPDPCCGCSACTGLRAAGEVRATTGAVVDGVLGLDLTPEPLRRWGQRVPALRAILVSGAAVGEPGVGAPGGTPVRLDPGSELDLGDLRARALPAGAGAVAFDLARANGTRLLYAPAGVSARSLPDLPAYDAVVLGGGDIAVAEVLAQLRRAGALTAATDVVVVGLGHDAPPTSQLDGLLRRQWGARVVADGAALTVGRGRTVAGGGRRGATGRTLLLGGARSGKSLAAERLVTADPKVTYVATGGRRDGDEEWAARVATHRARRPAGWSTVETTDLAPLLRESRGTLLVDCLSLWLTTVLDDAGAWDGGAQALTRVGKDVDELVDAWRSTRARVVAVSNEVGSGVVPATPSGRLFRDELGRLNARVAAESDEVLLVVAGQVVALKESL